MSVDWGGALYVLKAQGPDPKQPMPAARVRKVWTPAKAIRSAVATVAGQGWYRLYVNGLKAHDDALSGGWSDYALRVEYRQHEVTGLLKAGANCLGFEIGDGPYCGNLAVWNNPGASPANHRNYYGDVPGVRMVLDVTYADGTTEKVVTDGSWRSTFGPIQSSDWYVGERHDARLRDPLWATAGYDASASAAVSTRSAGSVPHTPALAPPVVRQAEFSPVSIVAQGGGYVLDFGQQITGRCRLSVVAPRGTVVTLVHFADLQTDGSPYTAGNRDALQTDAYVCEGGRNEVWEPEFTLHGFRYVKVTGLPSAPTASTLTAIVYRQDVASLASFECSDPGLTRLWSRFAWTGRNSMHVLLADSERNERMGWVADVGYWSKTGLFGDAVYPSLRKHLQDCRDAQASGGFADVAPHVVIVGSGSAGWHEGPILAAWNAYLMTGDPTILSENGDAILAAVVAGSAINPYGDYLNLGQPTDDAVFRCGWNYVGATLGARIMAVLGRTADATTCQSRANGHKSTFAGYVDANGTVQGDSQAGYVLALRWGLVPSGKVSAAFGRLVASLAANGPRFGFTGVLWVCQVLRDGGRPDLALAYLQRTGYPSFSDMAAQGASTTVSERWNPRALQGTGDDANVYSLFAFATPGCYLFETLAGIDVDESGPGFAKVVMRPVPGTLTSCRATYLSAKGLILSDWRIVGGRFLWRFTVPAGASASVTLPGESAATSYGPGTYALSKTL